MFKNTGVEFFKYKSKEDDVELLNLDSYRVRENGVTLFCISGNGATNLQEGKDFCEIPKVYLDLMLDGANSIKEKIDFIGFNRRWKDRYIKRVKLQR